MPRFHKPNNTKNKKALLIEAEGLELLREACEGIEINIPTVYQVNEAELVLEEVQAQPCSESLARLLGGGLAQMHKKRHEQYGFESDGMIGLNPQINIWSENWGEFFVKYRLGYQMDLIGSGTFRSRGNSFLQNYGGQIEEFLNQNTEHASLVHGDLWSGNYLCDKDRVWLIDPAAYYGDRDVDLAMSEMFGGFAPGFYHAYDEVYPRTPAYEKKKVIYNLYHYLNHYNLFGSSYKKPCEGMIEQIQNFLERTI